MPTLNQQILKSDIALLVSFLAGIVSFFGLHFNQDTALAVLNDVVSALFVIVPLILAVVREVQHTKLGVLPTKAPPAFITAGRPTILPPATPTQTETVPSAI